LPNPSPAVKAFEEGVSLVHQCLNSIKDLTRFPPKLFIFLPTASFAESYEEMLRGIGHGLSERNLDNVPVIGASVAACAYASQEVHALLLCLASEQIENVGTAVAEELRGKDAGQSSKEIEEARQSSIEGALSELGITGNRSRHPLLKWYCAPG
jgi:hypothetical protein